MVGVQIDGDIAAWARAAEGVMAEAVTGAVRIATDGAKLEVRQSIDRAGLSPKLGNMLGGQVFPPRGASLGAAGTLHARGASADRILSSVLDSMVILPRKGRHLAVPTRYNQDRRGRPRVSTEDMVRSRMAFIIRLKRDAGGLLWCLRVAQAQTIGKQARRDMVTAGGLIAVGSTRAHREDLLTRGFVPMFLLLPQVARSQVVDPGATWGQWADRVPGLVERAMDAREV